RQVMPLAGIADRAFRSRRRRGGRCAVAHRAIDPRFLGSLRLTSGATAPTAGAVGETPAPVFATSLRRHAPLAQLQAHASPTSVQVVNHSTELFASRDGAVRALMSCESIIGRQTAIQTSAAKDSPRIHQGTDIR